MEHFADLIIANSKATGRELKVSQKKIRVVYNAVDERKQIIDCPHDPLAVGMAGRINRWKGQKLLVDAAVLVHKNMPEVIFKIAGEAYKGEEFLKVDLMHYINSKNLENTIILLGQVDDMSSFYNTIDVFVLPSIQPEPFGLVVIEAMEYGIPVVATNHGGPTEIIENNVDGYLVDYHNAKEMASRILELLKDCEKRKQIGLKGQAKKRKYFSVDYMVKKIEDIFEEVMQM